MKIEYANTIAMSQILGKLGLQPLQQNDILSLYTSPFLENKPLSLHVNSQANTWFDAELLIGGTVVDFIREHLKRHGHRCSVLDAKQWLAANIGYPSLLEGINIPDYAGQDSRFALSYKTRLLSNEALGRLLADRYIPLNLARKHLQEVGVINTSSGKEFIALGLKNEDDGYAIRAKGVKAIVGSRAVSIIAGRNDEGSAIHIFKDIFDYLSAVAIQEGKNFNNKSIILNSYSCLEDSGSYVRNNNYRKVYTWFDNGETGQQATRNYAFLCNTQNDMLHKPMNHLYASGHDVNSWLVKQLSA